MEKSMLPVIWVRSALFGVFFWIWTGILVLIGTPVALFGSSSTVRRVAVAWKKGVMVGLAVIVGLRYRISGLNNLPDAPVIIASKHQSAWETMLFMLVRFDLVFALKEELTNIPLFGRCLLSAGSIKLDRGGAAKALRSLVVGGKNAIAQNLSILIFPEGTRQPPGAAPDYKPGVAALYRALKVPVVPVALNSGSFWGRDSFIKYPGMIDVVFMEPIAPGLDRETFMAELQSRIENQTQRLDPANAAPGNAQD